MIIATNQTRAKTYKEPEWVRNPRTLKKYDYLRECSVASLRGSPLRAIIQIIVIVIYPELYRCASFKFRECRLHLKWVQTYLPFHLELEAHNYN